MMGYLIDAYMRHSVGVGLNEKINIGSSNELYTFQCYQAALSLSFIFEQYIWKQTNGLIKIYILVNLVIPAMS